MHRRLAAFALVCAGLAGAAAVALTDLQWLTALLAPLAADGRVDTLSPGETAVLRSVALTVALALILSGVFLRAIARAMSRSRRRINVRLRSLAPQRISAALARLAAGHGRAYVVVLLALLLGGTAVRLAHLAQPVHDDEAGAYLNWSAEPLYVTFTRYGAPGNHVLHTALVAFSTRVFGNDPWAVRLPALLAGILCLPATFVVVRRLCGPWPALLALALLSAAHAAIEYSANARGYSLATLLGLCQTAAVLRAIEKPRWSNWRAVILPTALALYTLPTMIYLSAALALHALISAAVHHPRRHARPAWVACLSERSATSGPHAQACSVQSPVAPGWPAQAPNLRSGWHAQAVDPGSPGSTRGHVLPPLLQRRAFIRALLSFSLAGALTAALYAPFLLVGGAAALTNNEFYRPLPLADWLAAIPPRIARTLDLLSAGLGGPVLLLVLAAIGLVASRRLHRAGPPFWLILFAAPLAIACAQRLLPFARTLLYLQPFLYALCALGLCTLAQLIALAFARIFTSRYSATLPLRASVPSCLRAFFFIPQSAIRNPQFLVVACAVVIIPLLAAFGDRRTALLSPADFPDAAAVSQYLARSWPDDVPVFAVNPAVRPLLYHLRRATPNIHPIHEQPPAADLALWVRSADAQPTLAYRDGVDRLCADFTVGPVLRRFGSAEIVLLRSRAAGPTPQFIARADHPEDRP